MLLCTILIIAIVVVYLNFDQRAGMTLTSEEDQETQASTVEQQDNEDAIEAGLNTEVSQANRSTAENEEFVEELLEDANEEASLDTEAEAVEIVEPADSDSENYDTLELSVFRAIKSNNFVLLQELISSGADVVAPRSPSTGFNSFHYAAYRLNIEAMDILLQEGANIFRVDDLTDGENKMTALHIVAIRGGKHPMKAATAAHYLLSRGASLNILDSSDLTPAFVAVDNSSLAVLNTLIIWNVDLTAKIPLADVNLLHFAMASCNRPIIKALMDSAPHLADEANMFNRAPIHEAAAKNCVEGLKELILVHRISKQTPSPLYCENKCMAKAGDCLFGASPLHFAAKFECFEAVEFLFLIQSESKFEDERGFVALDYAATKSLRDYFTSRSLWECTHPSNGRAEEDMRYADSQPMDLKAYNNYRGDYLHKP